MKVHWVKIEEERILESALRWMSTYREKHGRYARTWYELMPAPSDPDYERFGFGSYTIPRDTPGTRPGPEVRERWRPYECHRDYVIRSDGDDLKIEGIDDDGSVRWEIEPGMNGPRKVGAFDGEWARRPHEMFLLENFRWDANLYRRDHGRFPATWTDLESAASAALPGTGRAYMLHAFGHPEPGDTTEWRPPGYKSRYRIARSSETAILIQSLDDEGRVGYEIDQDLEDPRKVGPVP